LISVESLQVSHRYLFLEMHIDGDLPFEAFLEEVAPSGAYIKLRYLDGSCGWEEVATVHVIEELGPMVKKEIIFKWIGESDEKDSHN
jgi:hypothetical protein